MGTREKQVANDDRIAIDAERIAPYALQHTLERKQRIRSGRADVSICRRTYIDHHLVSTSALGGGTVTSARCVGNALPSIAEEEDTGALRTKGSSRDVVRARPEALETTRASEGS